MCHAVRIADPRRRHTREFPVAMLQCWLLALLLLAVTSHQPIGVGFALERATLDSMRLLPYSIVRETVIVPTALYSRLAAGRANSFQIRVRPAIFPRAPHLGFHYCTVIDARVFDGASRNKEVRIPVANTVI